MHHVQVMVEVEMLIRSVNLIVLLKCRHQIKARRKLWFICDHQFLSVKRVEPICLLFLTVHLFNLQLSLL